MSLVQEQIRSEDPPVYCARVKPQGSSRAKHIELTDAEIIERARELLREQLNARRTMEEFTYPRVSRKHLDSWFLGKTNREEFAVVFLDSQNNHIATETMFEGTLGAAPVYTREIARRALELAARSVILSHNHPSGNPEPSDADIRVTAKVRQALDMLDIETLDHIIVDPFGVNHAMSLAERGLMNG